MIQQWKSINKNKVMIAIDLVVLCLLAVFAFNAFREGRANRFDVSGVSIVTKEQGFEYDFETITVVRESSGSEASKQYLTIRGWVVERGVPAKPSDTLFVVLQNTETGVCFRIPTMRVIYPGITEHFYDGITYEDSGFSTKLCFGKEINTDENEYAVYLYLKNKSGKKMVDTQTKVQEWMAGQSQ